jgi:hypothetical protein
MTTIFKCRKATRYEIDNDNPREGQHLETHLPNQVPFLWVSGFLNPVFTIEVAAVWKYWYSSFEALSYSSRTEKGYL